MQDERTRWIHALLSGVVANAFEQLQDLGSMDTQRRQEAQSARAWIMSTRDDHPFDYTAICGVLNLLPARGRRYARTMERKARPIRATAQLYGRTDPETYRRAARIDPCGRIGPEADT